MSGGTLRSVGKAIWIRQLAGLAFGLVLAFFALLQTASTLNLPLGWGRAFGAPFHSTMAQERVLAERVFTATRRADGRQAAALGRNKLVAQPLSARAMWLVGKGFEISGDVAAARQAMVRGDAITRRDAAVELWLGTDLLRRGQVAEGLRHFDLMIRGNRAAAASLMPRLVQVVQVPEGRRYLAPYVGADNIWYLDFMQSAVASLPKASPIADLLIEKKTPAPDVKNIRPVYAQLIKRLIAEKSYKKALQVYALLPGADREAIASVGGFESAIAGGGYPPFVWTFPDSSDRGGSLVSAQGGVGIDIFGAPGTVGIAASKVFVPRGARQFSWRLDDRNVNLQSEARWEILCLMGANAGKIAKSPDLLGGNVKLGKTMVMAVPGACDLATIDMRINGGVGRNSATVTMSHFAQGASSTAR